MSSQRVVYRFDRFAFFLLAALLAACSKEDTATSASNVVDKAAAAKLGFVVPHSAAPLAAFRFSDGEGKPLGLEDFRGEVLLINVWATWCTPCREEMPTLDRLQAKLGGSEFEVLALSIDQGGVAVVQDFYRDVKLKHLHLYIDQTGQAMSALNILGIPTTLLVDREGRELARFTGMKQWDALELVQFFDGVITRTRG